MTVRTINIKMSIILDPPPTEMLKHECYDLKKRKRDKKTYKLVLV